MTDTEQTAAGAPAPDVPLSEDDWRQWAAYVQTTFGLCLGEEAIGTFKTFFDELKEWNEKMNLVSFKSGKEVLYRHFADSLAGAMMISRLGAGPSAKIADIGTGAGFPGIPVHIASPYKDITLVESITKKTLFQAHIKEQLSLPGLKIVNDRVENIARDRAHRESYDFVLSRAVTKLSPNIEIALPLLKTGGFALLYKTEQSASAEELALAARAFKALYGEITSKFCYTIPGESRGYCVLAVKKTAPTPAFYPRKAGMPEKKPL